MAIASSLTLQLGLPFAVTAIEDQNRITITATHHIQQIMLLLA
jgi:hypothetical protein